MNIFRGFLLLLKKFLPAKQADLTFTIFTAAVVGCGAVVQGHKKPMKTADSYRKVKLSELHISISNYLFGFLCASCNKW